MENQLHVMVVLILLPVHLSVLVLVLWGLMAMLPQFEFILSRNLNGCKELLHHLPLPS